MHLFNLPQTLFLLPAFINGSGIHLIQAFSHVTITWIFGTLLTLSIFQTCEPCLLCTSMGNHEQTGAQHYDNYSKGSGLVESIFHNITKLFRLVLATV